jgi:hypothetical protein
MTVASTHRVTVSINAKLLERAKQAEAELAALKAALSRIDIIVYDVPKTGDADSAVMDVARVIAEVEWAAREEAEDE